MKGTIHNQESFLKNVAKQFGRERITELSSHLEWKHQPQWEVMKDYTLEQLVDVLEAQCEQIHTTFRKTTRQQLDEVLKEILQDYQANSIIINEDPRYAEAGLELTEAFNWNSTDREKSVKKAEQADVGITFSDITLAESGTVVLFSGAERGRSVSLLPENYVALIPKSTLVPRMSQATRRIHEQAEQGEDIASCINFITGPSNSADIEMNLVVGVHGPVRAAYIVIEDM